jgi:hypothetical protein
MDLIKLCLDNYFTIDSFHDFVARSIDIVAFALLIPYAIKTHILLKEEDKIIHDTIEDYKKKNNISVDDDYDDNDWL